MPYPNRAAIKAEQLKLKWLEILDQVGEEAIEEKLHRGWRISSIRKFFENGGEPTNAEGAN